MQYASSSHCVYYHRYHIVWATKYRYKVLCGDVRLRARDICRQVCGENGVEILHGVLSTDHVHMFVSVPPKLAVADLIRKMKGRSSYKLQREFPELKNNIGGASFGAEDISLPPTAQSQRTLYFSTWIITYLTLPASAGSHSLLSRTLLLQSSHHRR